MPELPEVEVVRRGLARHVVGRTIERAVFTGARVARRHGPGPLDLAARLGGTTVTAAHRRGKYLWLVLSAPESAEHAAFVLHLGMSGQLLVAHPSAPREKHLHAILDFVARPDESGLVQLRFVDQRTFGGVALTDLVRDRHTRHVGDPEAFVPEPIAHIAPDPLEPSFDQPGVVRAMKRRHSAVKRALLDQSLLSGVGNIYADEGLWRAGVHGERSCDALTKPALSRVLDGVRAVMVEALEQGGTSFDALYVDVFGASGYFERSLAAYGRPGRPCPRCGAPIRREPFMNRSSYSCPRCQPRPRSRAR